jgi:hypothetical protein
MYRASIVVCVFALSLEACVGTATLENPPGQSPVPDDAGTAPEAGDAAASPTCPPSTDAHPSLPSSFDDRFTTVKTEADVLAKRESLIETIWPCGTLPPSLPIVTERSPADVGGAIPANLTNLGNVFQLDFPTMNPMPPNGTDGGTGMAFLLTPAEAPRHRVVLLGTGHVTTFDEPEQWTNMHDVVQMLLTENYSVLLVYMPHFTPSDTTGLVAGSHNFMFSDSDNLDNPVEATNYRYFVEPSIVAINYLVSDAAPGGAFTDIALAGLSGGGWTTMMTAALDTRARLSVIVSGDMPGYVEAPTTLDAEQFVRSRLGVGDADLHVLGSDGSALGGAPRRQTQVFNRRDDCCFGEREYDTHGGVLADSWQTSVRSMEASVRATLFGADSAGRYRVEVDEMADHHTLSANSLQNILLAELDDDRKLVGAANSNGDLFYRGVNGNMWRRTFPVGGGASIETDTGVSIAGVATVTEGGPHQIDVFARDGSTGGGAYNLVHYYLADAQSPWARETLPAFIMSDPGVVAADGVVDVVMLASDASLWHWSSATQALENVSSNGFFGPPAAVRFQGALHIFARGRDSTTYHFTQSGVTSAWVTQSLPLVLSGFPTASACGQLICVAGLGTDSTARVGTLDAAGAWSGWSSLSAPAALRGTPSIGSTGAGIPLYVSTDHGTLGRFLQMTPGGPWMFSDLKDAIVASPTAFQISAAAQMTGAAQPSGTQAPPAGQTPAPTTMMAPPISTGAVISGGQSGALWIHRGATSRLGGWFD